MSSQKNVRHINYLHHCRVCSLKAQCLRKPDQPSARSVVVFHYKLEGYKKPDALQLVRDQIDSPADKRIYSKRLAIAEPPFGHTKEMGFTRFTL
ncbi:transposase [Endozoicomonas sp. 8E]|uniref:transposase n=1 Tax=Endozoicomonas sp. 8E TaxID=3035692 RepID=UPI00397751C7